MDSDLRESLAATHVLPWWSHRLPLDLERAFDRQTGQVRSHRLRLWIAISLGFCWLTFPLDLISVPDVWWLGLLLRLAVVTPLSLAAMRWLGNTPPAWLETLAAAVPPAVGLLAVLLTFAFSAHADTFRAAVVLCLGVMWMGVLIPMRFRDTVLFTLGTLGLGDAINLASAWQHHLAIERYDIVIAAHMAIVLSIVARFAAERDSRHSFLHGLRLRTRAADLVRSNEKLLEMSNTDPLTGVANRRFFDQALTKAWQAAEATSAAVALMMIDVDYFKVFNDTAGHLEGDRCLAAVARTIADQVRRDHDLAARFGGEEFVVLMPDTDFRQAQGVAERVRMAVAERGFEAPGLRPLTVTCSVGVALNEHEVDTPEMILKRADVALYRAKREGRNRVVFDAA